MSDIFNTAITPATRTIGTPIWWALVVLLALIAIAVALIAAAVNPELNGHVATAVVGVVILINAAIVSIALARVENDDPAAPHDDRAYR
jgi:uncharacterized membrane protein YoaK (UPF0700 family)